MEKLNFKSLILALTLLTIGTGQMWAAGASWIGNSFIVANGTWYNGSGSGQTYAFNNKNLGTITSLTLGGEVQTYGQTDGYNNSAKLHYKIDNGSSSYITLYWFKYESNNNFFHSASSQSQAMSETTIDISGLSAGDHTISVWFEQSDGNQWDSNNSNNYVATFRINPIVTFKANGGTGSDYTQRVTYNTNTALTANTFTKTGYDFAGWATYAGGSVVYANQGNVKLTAHTNLFAKWTAHNYTASNNIKHADGSTAGQYNVNYDATSISYTTTPSKTGYNLEGLYYESGLSNKIVNNDRSLRASTSYTTSGSKWNQTSAPNLYAKWTAKTYSITLDDDGDYGGNGSATVNYDATSLSISSNPTRDDYRINGFYAPGTEDLVADASGNLQASKTANTGSGVFSVTDANSKWIYDGDLTLYAHWTYDVTNYTVTYGVGTSYTSLGSLSAYNNSTSAAVGASPASVRSGHSVTFTASPNTGYTVEGWYTDAACTSGKHDAGSTTYTTSITGTTNVYVKYVEKTWSVAFAAGTGGTVTTPNSTPRTVGQLTGISIAATPSTGYTFNTWTITSGSGSFTSAETTNSNTFKPTAASTVTASFTETMHTITISGGHVYGGAATSTTAGVATSAKITANDPATGKKFTGWSLGSGVSLKGGYNLTDQTIEIYSTANATVTATYANRASVKMYFAKPSGWSKVHAHAWGGSDPSTTWPGIEITGTTETINHVVYNVFLYYTEADGIGGAATGSAGWTSVVFNDNGDGSKKTADLTISNGHYYFKSTPENGTGKAAALTSAWCIKGDWNSWSEDTDQITHSSATAGSKSISLTTGNKEFKIYNIVNETWWRFAGNVTADKAATAMNNSDGNMTITPSVAGPYTFALGSLNGTPTLAVTYPTSYTVTYYAESFYNDDASHSTATTGGTVAAVDGSSAAVASGSKVISGSTIVITASKASGYSFIGFYTNAACTTAVSGADVSISDNVLTYSSLSGNKTVYAKFSENMTTVNLSASPVGKGTFTKSAATVTSVKAGVTTKPVVTAVAGTGYRVNTSATVWSKDNNYVTLSSTTANPITITGTGTTGNTTALTATFTPKTYTITLNQNGATTESSPTSLTATYDGKANGASDVFTLTNPERTGYTFNGWFENEGGTGAEIITTSKYYKWEDNPYVTTTGLWKHDGDVTVYAKWTGIEYDVTLSASGETGYGSAGSMDEVTATYGSAMPAMGTAPTPAPGYKFMGYFTGHNGSGTKYYNADGTSATNWNIASTTTLYAYFQKAEISLALSAASVVPEGTVTATPTLTPTPQPTVSVCWHLLYSNGSEHAADFTPTGVGDAVSFTAPTEGGVYIVACVLRTGSSCGGGEVLDSVTQSFRVAGNNNVIIRYRDNSGNALAADGSVVIPALGSVGVKAPKIIGYTFSGWTLGDVLTNECADGSSCGTAKDSINISADYDGVLTATYTKKDMIYFNNTLGWDHVYVYFYSSGAYWDGNNGTGAQYDKTIDSKQAHYRHFWGEMTQIGESNVYYFDYQAAAAVIDPTYAWEINDYVNVAFTKHAQGYKDEENKGYEFFYETEVVCRGDFAHSKSMFVPLTSPHTMMNGNHTKYYDEGYWMNYPENSGYTLKIFDNTTDGALKKELKFPFSADKKMPMSITTDLEGNKTYGFKIVRPDGNEYGNVGTMTNGHSGDEGQGVWEFTYIINRAGLTTSSAGDYTFTLNYGQDLSSNYNYLVGVHYPEATGDFRVQYKDNDHTSWRTSAVIPAGSERDTVSYYVRKTQSPYIRVQKCTATYDEETSTTTVVWNNEGGGADILPDTISQNGVYNFIFTKSAGALVLSEVKPYTGNFYIRVDGAGSTDWDNFRASDHMMTYSDYADAHEGFTHYYAHWYDCSEKVKNIKFIIANDYSVNISDTLTRETASGVWTNISDYIDEFGNLSRSANVRFMYNKKTNAVSRAFIDGAYADGGNFLKLLAQTKDNIYLVPSGEEGDPQTEVTFKDNGNWIYEQTVYAQPGARYKLRSLFGSTDGGKHVITQYFKGGEGSTAADSATIIGGEGTTRYKIRLLYDFKTNRLVTAYVPSGTIEQNLEIHADIMFLREHQGDIEEISFAEGKSITEIDNVYCGIQFNKWTLNNRNKTGSHPTLSPLLSRYERDIFYISFPYDVKLSDVVGFGTYGQHWIIEYYDGAGRAEKGFWADSPSFWKFVTPAMKNSFTLKAGTGYIVALDLDELWYTDEEDKSAVWNNTDVVELLFPGNVTSISNTSVTYTMPEHTCTIGPRFEGGDDRTIKDSHWNVLGVPTYHNMDDGAGVSAKNTTWTAAHPNYIYTWNPQDNSLTPTPGASFDYKAMHAYMVQYYGDITFTTSSSPAPAAIAARRYGNELDNVEFRLELSKNDVAIDQAFVRLSNDDDVSAGFVFGEDMSKEFNKNKANIYTFIADVQAAGNVLPFMPEQTTVVPVGVKTTAAGEYTFSMPDGTDGIGVTLIDNVANTQTNLALGDYTVSLPAGTIDNRFSLSISPIQQAPTSLETIERQAAGEGARKVMVDGILYILRDGKVYDAQGRRAQ